MRTLVSMKALGLALLLVLTLSAQQRPPRNADDPAEPFPRGRKQVEDQLKADHVKNVADATELARMATELRDELDKTDAHVLSASTLKKTEEIEKLVRKIRSRMRH